MERKHWNRSSSARLSRHSLGNTLGSFRRRAVTVIEHIHPGDLITKFASRGEDASPVTNQSTSTPTYRPNSLDKVVNETHFSRKEIQSIYRAFKQTATNGTVDRLAFQNIFQNIFPHGDPLSYANCVFNTFDIDKNDTINFEEFVKSLSVLSQGTLDEKLNWMFRLYDDGNTGYLTWDRLHTLICAMDKIMGPNAQPAVTKQNLIDHTTDVFAKFDLNKNGIITRAEFMTVCKRDRVIRQSIAALNTINIAV